MSKISRDVIFSGKKAPAGRSTTSPRASNQGQAINLIDKVKSFHNLYPNFNGDLIADGGIKNEDLDNLKINNVDIAVQGGAIFN